MLNALCLKNEIPSKYMFTLSVAFFQKKLLQWKFIDIKV